MDKLIINIDASALGESACIRRLYWTVVDGYREKLQNNDVEFGSAFHEFVKVWRNFPGRYDLAIEAAHKRFDVPMNIKKRKEYLTKEFLTMVCLAWINHDKKDEFTTMTEPVSGRKLVEAKFSYPYFVNDQVEVNLCGTIDDLCEHKNGSLYGLRDYKSTAMWEHETYLAAYMLSPQLMFYRMMIKLYAIKYPDSIYAEMNKKTIGCFIDGIFLAGANKQPEFKRSEIFIFPQSQMDEFEMLVKNKIDRLIDYNANEVLEAPPREGMLNGSCKTVYGPCKFFQACKQIDLISTNHILRNKFIQRNYNPLRFGEEHKETCKN